jgi:RNA polymerase sigma-70 factor (family 1)
MFVPSVTRISEQAILDNPASHIPPGGSTEPLHLRIRAGEERAFSEVHAEFKARLLFYAQRFLSDWRESEDIVADAFLLLWQHRAKITSDQHVKNFLFLAVRTKALNRVAKQERHVKILADISAASRDASEDSFDTAFLQQEMMHLLHQAVKTLPPECRKVFELAWDKELGPGEIARALDMHPGTVRSQKRRAIQLIKSWFKNNTPVILLIIKSLSPILILFLPFLAGALHIWGTRGY